MKNFLQQMASFASRIFDNQIFDNQTTISTHKGTSMIHSQADINHLIETTDLFFRASLNGLLTNETSETILQTLAYYEQREFEPEKITDLQRKQLSQLYERLVSCAKRAGICLVAFHVSSFKPELTLSEARELLEKKQRQAAQPNLRLVAKTPLKGAILSLATYLFRIVENDGDAA